MGAPKEEHGRVVQHALLWQWVQSFGLRSSRLAFGEQWHGVECGWGGTGAIGEGGERRDSAVTDRRRNSAVTSQLGGVAGSRRARVWQHKCSKGRHERQRRGE